MPKTVIGLLDSDGEAHAVVRELTQQGFARERIGLMARESGKAVLVKERGVDEEATAAGAVKGAGTGAAVGGFAGLALALVPVVLPGVGPFITAGAIAAAIGGAGIGAVAGGLIGGLTKMGVPEEQAHYYAEGVRRGGTLVTVSVDTDREADQAVSVMQRHGAADIEERAAGWKREGWSGRFASDEDADQGVPVLNEEYAGRAQGVLEGHTVRGGWSGKERRQGGAAPFRGTDRRLH